MKKLSLAAISLSLALFGAGCSDTELKALIRGPTYEAGHSAQRVAFEAKEYYEMEIMDNLVRVANGQFFVQTDLNELGAVLEWRVGANFGGGRSGVDTGSSQNTNTTVTTAQATSNRPLNDGANLIAGTVQNTTAATLGLVGAASSMVTRNLSASLSPEHDNTNTMNASPVVQDPNLANLYVKFVNLPQAPDLPKRATAWFQPSDFISPGDVISQLITSKPGSFAEDLWKRIPEEEQQRLATDNQAKHGEDAKKDLAHALNPILQGLSIYKPEFFRGVQLADSTYNSLLEQPQPTRDSQPPTGPTGNVAFLNRGLIEDYFKNDIAPLNPPETPEKEKKKRPSIVNDDGPDFDYNVKAPDSVGTLEKRLRGFDFPGREKPGSKHAIYSIECVLGGPDQVNQNLCVPGALITFAPDKYGRMRMVPGTRLSPYPKGTRTYYIPKVYANAFFHLCSAVVSRAPAKTGASPGGSKPATPVLLLSR